MPFDAFISYSSLDKVRADAACARLEAAGVRCWIAPRDIIPGTEWGAAIVDAIDSCRVMVLIFSANANASPQIRREVERAVSSGVPIIPLRIEDVKPSEALAYFVNSVHWLDALTPPFEQHLERLAYAVKALLEAKPGGEVRVTPQAVASHAVRGSATSRVSLKSLSGPKRGSALRYTMIGFMTVALGAFVAIGAMALYQSFVAPTYDTLGAVVLSILITGPFAFLIKKLLGDPATTISLSMRQATMSVRGDYDQIMETSVAALKRMKAVILSVDSKTGKIEATLGISWRSHGENLFVFVTRAEAEECSVHFRRTTSSRTPWSTSARTPLTSTASSTN